MRRMIAALMALVGMLYAVASAQTALPDPPTVSGEMILGESTAEYLYEATLYYIGSDGASLSPASRTLLVRRQETLVGVVLEALFDASGNVAQAAIAPGDTRVISYELASGIVTVNLSIEARNVQNEQELLMMYLAIARTLGEIEGIHGVNVLINGRQEGILRVPFGVISDYDEDIPSAWARLQTEADRYLNGEGATVTRTAMVYFPSTDRLRLVPEARMLTFGHDDCATTLLETLCSDPQTLLCAGAAFPMDGSPLSGVPVMTVTATGERVLEVNLRQDAVLASQAAGIPLWQVCGAVTLTLCSFLPELDGVRLSVEGEQILQVEFEGGVAEFSDGCMRRRDFSGAIGSAACIYLSDAQGNLIAREVALTIGAAQSPRALLEILVDDEQAEALYGATSIVQGLSSVDILGVYVDDSVATVNLSSRFYSACQSLDQQHERTAVYAMVNTLCELTGVHGVRFLFEGRSVETLSQHIYLKSTLLPNPGLVVTG